VPALEKRLEIHLQNQVVIAYEYNVPVFMTRTATGAHFSDGDYTTPQGFFMTNRKRPSRHMAAGDRAAPNSYDLPGIPWVCYLTKSGISFHGTYWHNDFGKPRSHGCVNLSPAAAKWVYRWTLPVVPFDQTFFDDDTGTSVQIMQ
jgi:lipoprotein-anchoring transpeptidase ErfK/SrfK